LSGLLSLIFVYEPSSINRVKKYHQCIINMGQGKLVKSHLLETEVKQNRRGRRLHRDSSIWKIMSPIKKLDECRLAYKEYLWVSLSPSYIATVLQARKSPSGASSGSTKLIHQIENIIAREFHLISPAETVKKQQEKETSP
jgi:hypothetical protein